jgi:D-alanyl-D-alanine dipeptidase
LVLAHCQVPEGAGGGAPRAAVVRAAARHGLVDVREAVPGIVVDLPYATARNVAGRPLYPRDMPCLVERGTARKLAAAQAEVARGGFRIKVWDAYRPPKAHLALWDAAPVPGYVSPPSESLSMHCAGAAVDVTLVDGAGREVRMPTEFDHFSPRASSSYTGGDAEVAANLEVLQRAMRRAGFSTISTEWWHFWNPQGAMHAVPSERLGIVLPAHVRAVKNRP